MAGYLHINRDPRRCFGKKSAAAAENSIATKVPYVRKYPDIFRIRFKAAKI
jgi:hypothetical protein